MQDHRGDIQLHGVFVHNLSKHALSAILRHLRGAIPRMNFPFQCLAKDEGRMRTFKKLCNTLRRSGNCNWPNHKYHWHK